MLAKQLRFSTFAAAHSSCVASAPEQHKDHACTGFLDFAQSAHRCACQAHAYPQTHTQPPQSQARRHQTRSTHTRRRPRQELNLTTCSARSRKVHSDSAESSHDSVACNHTPHPRPHSPQQYPPPRVRLFGTTRRSLHGTEAHKGTATCTSDCPVLLHTRTHARTVSHTSGSQYRSTSNTGSNSVLQARSRVFRSRHSAHAHSRRRSRVRR